MPTLSESLQSFDLGHLLVIAELWGIDIQASDLHGATEQLLPDLLNPALVKEGIEVLPDPARSALADLIAAGGRIPWVAFTRRYGAVREIGPGRRDREKPYRQPISTTEILWYRGLVARAFFDAASGPEEFAYIPDDLLALLPPEEPSPQQPLGRPALPDERGDILNANDHLLDDACTLLAALRSNKKIPQEYRSRHLKGEELIALLDAAGLRLEDGMPHPEKARLFLEARRGDAMATLFNAWRISRDFNEMRLVHSFSIEGEWRNDPQQTRRTMLEHIARLSKGQWWSLPAFIRDVKRYMPDFQRPAGDYDSWFIRDRATGEFLRGFEQWEKVEGALIRYMISGPLYWLGVLDLATPAQNMPVSAFRLSRWSESLLQEQTPQGLAEENAVLVVRSDGRIFVPSLAPRAVRYQIARFGAWEKESPDFYCYRLTPSSLAQARQQGLTVNHLLALLRHHAETIPPSLVRGIERWEQSGAEAHIEQVLVLRASSPEILTKLRDSRAGRFLGVPLGPAAVVVKPGAAEKVLAALAELGYLGEVRIQEEV